MKFVTSDGWNPKNQWIYGRLWFKSGDNEVESDANLSGESEYDVNFTNPNDNNRGYTDTVIRVHKLKAFRNRDLVFDPEKNVMDQQKIVIAEIKKNSYNNMKLFKDSNNNDPHYIKEGDDEIYVLRYQGRIEGYYGGERQTFPSMSIDISGDIKVKLPGRFKSGNGYKFIGGNMWGYKSPNPFGPFIENAFFGYNHINKSYYNLDGQNNNMLYLNENDVVYERDNKTGLWHVGLKNKIQIVRIFKSVINVILEIDENWNMTLVLYIADEARTSNILPIKYKWLYGKMILETNTSNYPNKFIKNFMLDNDGNNRINITQYTGDGIGMQRGRYYSISQCGRGATGYCDNRILLKTSKTFNIKLLPVTTLNDFLRIDVTMLMYNASNSTYVGYDDPFIDYVDRIGIREPNVNIIGKYINYPTDKLSLTLNHDQSVNDGHILDTGRILDITNISREYWEGAKFYLDMKRDAVVNISEALEYKYIEDGSFEVSIKRPISITYRITYKYTLFGDMSLSSRNWTVILQIDIDTNWNVTYTYNTPSHAWFQTDNPGKNIQGEMRIFVNEVNNTNNSEVSSKIKNKISDYRNGNLVINADNYTFIDWADKTNVTKAIKYESNTESNNKKKFRSLNNLIRFDATFASYYFLYQDDYKNLTRDSYMDKSGFGNKLFDNTITLCCVQPILYFCTPDNKSKPVVDVLTYLNTSNVINVSDYVYADSKDDITYEISDVSNNTTTLSNTTLSKSQGAGSCILSATQGNFKISIKLQWFF